MEQTVDGGEPDKLIMGLAAEEFEWQDRLRLVPYRGVNRGRFMLALKPDMVRIELGGFEYSASKVLIGLDGGTLSGDRAYRAIIHPALTEGEGTTKMDANSNKPVSDGSANPRWTLHRSMGNRSGIRCDQERRMITMKPFS